MQSDKAAAIRFNSRGEIMRGGTRVGWVERRDDHHPVTWQVRLAPASGKSGLLPGNHLRLRDAKAAALEALS